MTEFTSVGEPISRRALFRGAGGMIVGFTLAPATGSRAAAPTVATTKPVALDQVDTYLVVNIDGTVTVYTNKVDIGTGVRTAFLQIAAEELDLPLDRISIVEGDTWLTPDQLGSGGSLSIQVGGIQIRQAAATVYHALLDQAARRFGRPVETLTSADGMIRDRMGGKGLSYGELAGGDAFRLALDPKAPTKRPADFRFVGRAIPRVDIPDKVFGRFTYMHDFRVPGMLHGRVIRPPAIGAELLAVDDSSVLAIPGVTAVVRERNFLGVVAETEWAAIRASRELKARWSAWEGLPDPSETYDYVRKTPVAKEETTAASGDVTAGLAKAVHRRSGSYQFAIHTHGSIGPSCAIAEWKDGVVTCWSATQGTHELKKMLAVNFGLHEKDVHILYIDGAGCYGRNGHEDAAADAVVLARAVGKPVRVQWMRHDEHGWDPKGPATVADLTGGVDADGRIVAWSADHWAPLHQSGALPLAPSLAGTALGLPQPGPGFGNMHQNSRPDYDLPNISVLAHRTQRSMLRGSWIRTPGRMQNNFANESFVDELAAAARQDPLEFRLRHMSDPRGIAVLKAVAERVRWEPRPSSAPERPTDGIARGRGVAYIRYDGVRTYAAGVAEVAVDLPTGAIRCTRFTVAHDCGQIINPTGVIMQIEGAVIQTVSRTLIEEVTFSRSAVTSTDWGTYPILTFPDVPEVDTVLIDRPDQPPWGAGEPAAAIVPAAIANAVFDATGLRVRTIPFLPARVKMAMADLNRHG